MPYTTLNVYGGKIVSLSASKLTVLPIQEGDWKLLDTEALVKDAIDQCNEDLNFEYRLQEIKACEKNYWE